jgi:hypothetical protein
MNAKFTPERLKIPRIKLLHIGGRSGIYYEKVNGIFILYACGLLTSCLFSWEIMRILKKEVENM